MMKLADYIAKFLVDHGISDVFLVSGGGIMHLLDSVSRQPGLNYYCNYHEQACAVSAEGYARVRDGVGACLVTVGPGGANALSGILGSWYDSIPMIVICGQVRRNLIADYSKVRQIGPQEGNHLAMARPVTKYAAVVLEPNQIRYELERAYYSATAGRPGPVWLEIPLDVQDSQVEETLLQGFAAPTEEADSRREPIALGVARTLKLLRQARRPILIAGNGIHLARSEPRLKELLSRLDIPVILPDAAKDLIPEDQPSYLGIFGTAGQRRANFAVQNSDFLLSLGAGLCLKKVGFNFKGFAPKAKKVIVDIDPGQLYHQVITADLPILADVGLFLEEMLRQLERIPVQIPPKWLAACRRWKERYPLIVDEYYADKTHVNSYVFVDKLADHLTSDDLLVAGNGLDTVSYLQAYRMKDGQRAYTSINWGAMGWDLPLAIGTCIGSGGKQTICITGDGSLQWNIQELLTIKYYNLPIKIFLFNNHGYASIRATQQTFYQGRFVGSDETSGVGNPDYRLLAAAYGLQYTRILDNDASDDGIAEVLSIDGPVLCEVNISREQGITPKASAFVRDDGTIESRPLEDMFPFLPREEVWENMHQFDDDIG